MKSVQKDLSAYFGNAVKSLSELNDQEQAARYIKLCYIDTVWYYLAIEAKMDKYTLP